MVLQWWKQGLGFILSLVATPNNINIIETHDISTKNIQGRRNSEIILLWSREDENCVGLQEHALEFSLIYGFPNVTASIQREYHNHHNISQG